MNHMQILTRAWKILWSYRTLWIFGILVAMTSGSFSTGSNSGLRSGPSNQNNNNNDTYQLPLPKDFNQAIDQLNGMISRYVSPETERTIIITVISLLCLGLLLLVAFRIAYYVGQVALVRMVDGYEATGEKRSFRQGFRLGWSRPAVRLFLIDLVIGLPVAIVFILLFTLAALPVLLSLLAGTTPTIAGIIATVGLAFLLIFLAVIVGVVMSLILELIRRACVLQGLGVLESIRAGWQMLIHRFKDVGILWLILVGVQIGLFVVIIPVVLVLVVAGLIVGGGLGVTLYALVQAMTGMTAAIIIAALLGGLLFFTIIGLPMLFLNGLKETYFSTTWTLAYRELAAQPAIP